MNRLQTYLLTVANLYTALWVAVNIPYHEPNLAILVVEWWLISVAINGNLTQLAKYRGATG